MQEELNMESVSVNSDEQALQNSKSTKRESTINDTEALEEQLAKMKKALKKKFKGKNMPWSERLVVVSEQNIELEDSSRINDDVQREVKFYNICIGNVKEGLKRIADEGLKLDRPQDYMADMFKDDVVMTRIRSSLVKQQVRARNFEEQKLKKYAKKIQKRRMHMKNLKVNQLKNQTNRAISKWHGDLKKKGGHGMVADLDDYIKNETTKRKKGGNKFHNMKNKKIKKGARPGKSRRMRTMNKKKSRMGGRGK